MCEEGKEHNLIKQGLALFVLCVNDGGRLNYSKEYQPLISLILHDRAFYNDHRNPTMG